MCFFHFVQEDNGIGFPANCLGQLTAFFVANISGRRSDQTAHAEFLHVFAHVDTNNIVLIVEQRLCKCFCQFCFADTGRTEEQERTQRTVRVLDSGTGPQDCLTDFFDCLILTDDTFVKNFVHVQELFTFAFHQFCNRNTGPSADDTGNLFFCDFIPEQRVLAFLLFFCNGLLFFQLLFQLRQTTVF